MTTNPRLCGICYQRRITKPSSDWCSECNQALCTQCKDLHVIIKALQHHSLIPIANYLSIGTSFSLVEGHCSLHDDKCQLFCQSHDCLLCLTCLEGHMNCEGVVRISKLTKDIKTSEKFIETKNDLSEIILKLSKLQSQLEDNLRNIKIQKESTLREINQIREQMNNHLNQIESALKTELCEIMDDQCHSGIDMTLQEVKKEKTNVEHFQQQIEDLSKYGSDLQTFFGLRKIIAKAATANQYLQTLAVDGKFDKMTLTYEINKHITDFLADVKSLGIIRLQTSPGQIKLESTKDTNAQLVGSGNKSISDIQISFLILHGGLIL
ncbi:tripartite motif-containing protein 66-like [Mytilus trossulus]|uniref:tripartite motif-containing protein 66-like n=1 Tax=Mytilus trossulus TaxID=6551 RepID=UPI0030053091